MDIDELAKTILVIGVLIPFCIVAYACAGYIIFNMIKEWRNKDDY